MHIESITKTKTERKQKNTTVKMKVTVCFGDVRILVPCGSGELLVRDLISEATRRYKKAAGKVSNVHTLPIFYPPPPFSYHIAVDTFPHGVEQSPLVSQAEMLHLNVRCF